MMTSRNFTVNNPVFVMVYFVLLLGGTENLSDWREILETRQIAKSI